MSPGRVRTKVARTRVTESRGRDEFVAHSPWDASLLAFNRPSDEGGEAEAVHTREFGQTQILWSSQPGALPAHVQPHGAWGSSVAGTGVEAQSA